MSNRRPQAIAIHIVWHSRRAREDARGVGTVPRRSSITSRRQREWEEIADVLCEENEIAEVWSKVLEAARRSPNFYANRVWTALISPAILRNVVTMKEVGQCIDAFSPHLSDAAIFQIESAILSLSHDAVDDRPSDGVQRWLTVNKARLLSRVPAKRRGSATIEFLSRWPETPDHGVQEVEPIYGGGNLTSIEWMARQGVDVENPVHRQLLEISEALSALSAKEITTENVADVLQRIGATEQLLGDSLDAVDERVSS